MLVYVLIFQALIIVMLFIIMLKKQTYPKIEAIKLQGSDNVSVTSILDFEQKFNNAMIAYAKKKKEDEKHDLEGILKLINKLSKAQSDDLYATIDKAVNMYPDDKELFENIFSIFIKELNNADLGGRRSITNILSDYTNRYLYYCSWDNFNYALKKKKEVEKHVDALVKELDKLKEKHLKDSMTKLEKLVSTLKKASENEKKELFEEITSIDESFEKNDIKLYNLEKRYKKTLNMLTEIMQSDANMDQELYEYNLSAIEHANYARIKLQEHVAEGFFTTDKDDYNKEEKMMELVELMAGWDSSKLSQATSMFVSSVYGEIFSKLKPESRPMLTLRMLEAEKKRIEKGG